MQVYTRFYKVLLFILSISVITAQDINIINPEGAGFSYEGLERYEKYLQKEIDAGRIPGAVSLISRYSEVAHYQALGYNNLTTKSPMSKDKIFYIQSMTKPIISVAFMTLYEEGHFLLTDPVSKYIPEFKDLKVMKIGYDDNKEMTIDYVPLNKPVEIWHLLSHTAGFSHGLGQNDYDKKLYELLYGKPYKTIKERVMALLSYPLMGQPGEQWNYSASPDVLALLIEHFSGQSVDQFLEERIFRPLGMSDTGYNLDTEDLGRLAGLHQVQEDGSLAYAEPWGPLQGNTCFGGTHGLFSTAEDYLKFGQMLLNNGELGGVNILSRKTLELMTQNHIKHLPYSPGNGFGLGFGVRTDIADSKLSGSEGAYYWSGAFNTYFVVDPAENLVSILMTQSWPYNGLYGTKMRQLVYSAIAD